MLLFDFLIFRYRSPFKLHGLFVCICSITCFSGVVRGAENEPDFASSSNDSSDVRFVRDIQPIFAKHCLSCHGLDEAEGGLQFHSPETSIAAGDSGLPALVPGYPERSELIKRVTASEVELRMPPEGDRLTEDEVQQLRDWIQEGAQWETHWAYAPIDSESIHVAKDDRWGQSEIDQFVLRRLDVEGMTPSPQADKSTLIKRLYYDLIGLPPTPSQVQAFVDDPRPEAYGLLVEQLLASEHFGERWGRHWLDKARYADSDGYEKDNHRPDAWRYRDWVIHAINADMPFDQFTIEQIAGDLLPDATTMQKLATAFHRQTLTNTEGGTDQEQWRIAAVMDRTETIGSVWLGLSVGCARCHSHKYDQISHDEYYQLFAYFNNADEVNSEIPRSTEKYRSIQSGLEAIAGQLKVRRKELSETIQSWLPELKKQAKRLSDVSPEYHDLLAVEARGPDGVVITEMEDGSFLVSGDNPEVAKYTIEAELDVEGVTGLQLEVLPHDSLNAGGPGRTLHGNFVLNELRLYASSSRAWESKHLMRFASAAASFAQKGWPVEGAVDGVEGAGKQGTGWAISPQFGASHVATFALQNRIDSDRHCLQIVLNHTYGSQHTIGRFRIKAITGSIGGTGMPESIQEILVQGKLDAPSVEQLVEYQLKLDDVATELKSELDALEEELKAETMKVRVIGERTVNRRATHVLARGDFKRPAGLVQPATLGTLPKIRSRSGSDTTDRLDFAEWLVSGVNPIVPRVAINHVWRHLFGSGIVPTMNDFGVRGDPPSHPDLLDHLAKKFIADGWSRKKLIEYIVKSSTYQQSSRHRPEYTETDPGNRLLHRQNRFRVEAEIIRDITLSAAGILSTKIGGPSVFPPIPESVTDLTYNSSFKWETSNGDDRFRRGLYTYFKRTAPHPNLITFDCPDSNVTNVARDRSNTPIAALVTLNNETFVEAAQAMARRILEDGDLHSDRDRLHYAIQLCIAREPQSEEIADFVNLLETSRKWYGVHADDAKQIVGDGAVEEVELSENAAWVATLRMILNLDEFITRE